MKVVFTADSTPIITEEISVSGSGYRFSCVSPYLHKWSVSKTYRRFTRCWHGKILRCNSEFSGVTSG